MEAPKHSAIERVLQGDSDAFRSLIVQHERSVFALIGRQVRDSDLTRDLVQETFLKAFSALPRFRREARFGSWLIRIALNVTHSYFSSKRYRESAREDLFFAAEVERGMIENDADVERITDERIALMRIFIAELKPIYREVFVLCSLEGRSYEEVAVILEIPYGTVCSRMGQAYSIIKERFKQEGVTGD